MVLLLLLKVTLVFSLALAALPLMRRMSSASRHLLCVCATGAVLVLPLTMLVPAPIRISAITFVATARPQPSRAVLPLAQIGFVLWAVGAVLLMLRILLGYIRLAQILQTAASTEMGSFFRKCPYPWSPAFSVQSYYCLVRRPRGPRRRSPQPCATNAPISNATTSGPACSPTSRAPFTGSIRSCGQ